jgi:hypothetical protein
VARCKGEFSEKFAYHEWGTARKSTAKAGFYGPDLRFNALILLAKKADCVSSETTCETFPIMHRKPPKRSCTLCSAVAYCCGAVALCVIAALLGRFLPRLGPLVYSSGPFFFKSSVATERTRDHSAAAWNGPSLSSGTAASASASESKSPATCANLALRSRRRSSM